MPARIPLDVDLEDRLLYGLTPTRLVYLVISLLAAFATWSGQWAAAPIRVACAAFLLCGGAVAAWGRWRGRPTDRWVTDLAFFVVATYRLRLRRPRLWWRR